MKVASVIMVGIILAKILVHHGNKKIDVYLRLENKKEKGLGKPLPSGRMRVNQRDDDGSLEFIGENVIDHTARNEEILIKLGSSF